MTDGHQWHFLTVPEGDGELAKVVVVCERCGVIRERAISQNAVVELGGKCPAAPDRKMVGV